MRKWLMGISILSLVVLFVAPVLHAAGAAPAGVSHWGMAVGTIGWFATAPFWMRYRSSGVP